MSTLYPADHTHDDRLFTITKLAFFNFCITIMFSSFLRYIIFPAKISIMKKATWTKPALAYKDDLRQTLGVLQQLQVLIGTDATQNNPSLAEVSRMIHTIQREFGKQASLETVIQALVAQDIERQLTQRKTLRNGNLAYYYEEDTPVREATSVSVHSSECVSVCLWADADEVLELVAEGG